ncbi:hypothetical protein [Ekhidna sp.]|uniref:hypothetical protein n=1 Tax=Ekhidna sp. TaxID=2608089 RepID=UPI003512ED92
MKKIILSIFLTSAMFLVTAQEATQQGNVLFEVGLTPLGTETLMKGNSTGFALMSVDGSTIFSIGAEAGFFVKDDFALKFGLGYTDLDGTNYFSYKLGIKQYMNGAVPVQVDLTGATWEDFEGFGGSVDTPDPLWLGLQFGYAAFLSDDISFEPTLRYNISMNQDFSDQNILELRFSFAIFL